MLLKLYLILYLLLPNVVQPFHFFHIFLSYYGSTVKDCPKKVTNLLFFLLFWGLPRFLRRGWLSEAPAGAKRGPGQPKN